MFITSLSLLRAHLHTTIGSVICKQIRALFEDEREHPLNSHTEKIQKGEIIKWLYIIVQLKT